MASMGVMIGRILLGQIFLLAGIHKMMDWQGTAASMTSQGMPWVPFFLTGAVIVETFGGLSLILGVRARLGAMLLAVFLVPVTLVFHDFWTLDGPQRALQMIMFQKNLAMIGGLILLAVQGPGRLGFDKG